MTSVFDRFPSAQDLLSRPVLRRLTETLDRQIVVGRVKQYLGELRSQFEQANAEGKFPSMAGLAERIARWIAEREELGPRLVINATGDLLHSNLQHAPIAEAACSAMISSALSGVFDSQSTLGSSSHCLSATEARLAKLAGADAACVCNSLSAAVSLMFSAEWADRRVLVRRGDVIELPDGLRLSELAQLNGVDLAEVGAANRVRQEDFTTALESEAVAWLRIGTDSPNNSQGEIDMGQVRNAAPTQFSIVEVLTEASVIDWTPYGVPHIPVMQQRLAAGVDLVIFPGDRWLGGPAVGIVAGKKELVDQLKAAGNRFAAGVDPIRAAGLDAAVRMYDDPTTVSEKHPILSLLTASPENLKNRATRIAPQLAALSGVAAANVVESKAAQSVSDSQTAMISSFRVEVVPETLSVAEVRQELASHPQFSILAVNDSESLLFDLRSVHPRYDAELVARISDVFMNEKEPAE